MTKKAVFIGDIFRTHTSLSGGKFGDGTRKLSQLLAGNLAALGYSTCTIEDSSSIEVARLYRCLFGEMNNVHTWAIRSQTLTPAVEMLYDSALGNVDLIMGFELPESLYAWSCKNRIIAMDFAFHFIRFEKDYRMMLRSNSDVIDRLLDSIRYNASRLDTLSILSAVPEIAVIEGRGEISVFAQQTRFDRSKFDGRGGIVDDLELLRSSGISVDFYKPHPMEHRPEVELYLRRNGAELLPFGGSIYAFLARYGHKTRIISVSSGLTAEADMIGVKAWQMLRGFPWVVDGFEAYSSSQTALSGRFVPVDHRIFTREFLAAALTGSSWRGGLSDHPTFNLKEFWNVKWS